MVSITLLGFFLGQTFPALGQNIDYAVIAIMLFSLIPVAYEWRKHRRNGKKPRHASSGRPSTRSSSQRQPAEQAEPDS